MRRALLAGLTCLATLWQTAGAQDAGQDSPLTGGQGVRALGMGGAASAWLDEPSALFWNPATLYLAPVRRLELQHTQNAFDTRTEQFALVVPTLDYGSWAVGGALQTTTDIVVTDPLSPAPQGFENFNRFKLGLGYGVKGPYGVGLGAALRVVGYRFMGVERAAWGIDLGLVPVASGPWSVGVAVANLIPPTYSFSDGLEDKLPRRGILGVAFRGHDRFVIAAQMESAQREDSRFRAGAEYAPAAPLALRAGFDGFAPTFGIGVRYDRIRFDYAFVSPSDLGSEHRFGLSFDLGRTLSSQRADRAARLDRQVRDALSERARSVEQDLAGQADRAYRGRDWEAAARLYTQLDLLAPDNADYRGRLDLLARRRDSVNQARIDLAVASAGSSERQSLLQSAFDEQMAAGQWNAALAIADRLAREGADTAEAGALARRAGDSLTQAYERAMGQGRRALAAEQWATAAGSARVALLYRAEDDAAMRILRRAEVGGATQRALAALLEAVAGGDTTAVLSRAQDVLALDPQQPLALKYLREFRTGQDIDRTSVAQLQADAEAWGWYTQGFVEFRAGRYEAAIVLWQKVVDRYPGNEAARKNIEQARLRLQGGDSQGER
jgi:hypothetical protein